jgi:hypothetical protein
MNQRASEYGTTRAALHWGRGAICELQDDDKSSLGAQMLVMSLTVAFLRFSVGLTQIKYKG